MTDVKMVKLGDVANVGAGQGAPQGDGGYDSDGIPFIKAGNLEELIKTRNEFETCRLVNSNIAQKYKLKIYPKNSVVFAKSGMSAKKGRVYCLNNESYVVNHLAVITPNESVLLPRFLKYFFQFFSPKSLIRDEAYPSIRLEDINNVQIPLSSIEGQNKIIKTLDQASNLRRKRKKAIALLDDYLKAVFLEMFGDPVTNPKNWNTEILKNITTKIGSGATPRGGKRAYKEEGISLIRSLNIHDSKFLHKNLAFIDDEQASALSNVVVEPDDVLLNITGASVCRCAMVDESILPARVNQHVSILRSEKEVLIPKYLLHLLISSSFKQKLLRMATAGGATREALTKLQIEQLEIPVPPIEKQKNFAEACKTIEKMYRSMVAQSKELDTNFNALMQELFNKNKEL